MFPSLPFSGNSLGDITAFTATQVECLAVPPCSVSFALASLFVCNFFPWMFPIAVRPHRRKASLGHIWLLGEMREWTWVALAKSKSNKGMQLKLCSAKQADRQFDCISMQFYSLFSCYFLREPQGERGRAGGRGNPFKQFALAARGSRKRCCKLNYSQIYFDVDVDACGQTPSL